MGQNGWAGILLAAIPTAGVGFAAWRISVVMRRERRMERDALEMAELTLAAGLETWPES